MDTTILRAYPLTHIRYLARIECLQMNVDCTMSVIMAYYNSRLALWEPLIEPNEGSVNGKRVSTPWELKTKVKYLFNDRASKRSLFFF